jgi:bifunctional non-homologous end joining protein LigD
VTGCGPAWTKAKCRGGQEVVVAGWSGDRRTLRSLVVGVHRGGRLVHVGRVGTGFTQETARRLLARLLPLATKESPFDGTDAPKPARDVTWVEPRLVAEIEFAGWTGAGAVRQAAFKGLREDKSAIEIVDERPDEPTAHAPATNRWSPVARRAASLPAAPAAIAPQAASHGRTSVRSPRSPASAAQSNVVAGIVVSNPAKALWPEPATDPAVVKLDLARYYEAVAPHLMAHIAGRPCSLVRAPDGIGGEQFFQRHAMPGMSSLISLVKVKGDRKPYVQLDRPEALVAVAQIAAVELHPWNCAPGEPELPGRLVFDLDPAPDVDFADVVTAAKELKGRLEALGLTTFCKTTGGKGLHVVIPLDVSRPGYRVTWEQAKAFAQAVCATMAADSPDRYLIKMTKALRGGRIFLDYLRNDRTATAVAPLSPRARPGAAVSMPLAWSQMTSRLDPARYTIRTVPRLVAHGFAWEGYDAAARPLADAIRRLVTPRS